MSLKRIPPICIIEVTKIEFRDFVTKALISGDLGDLPLNTNVEMRVFGTCKSLTGAPCVTAAVPDIPIPGTSSSPPLSTLPLQSCAALQTIADRGQSFLQTSFLTSPSSKGVTAESQLAEIKKIVAGGPPGGPPVGPGVPVTPGGPITPLSGFPTPPKDFWNTAAWLNWLGLVFQWFLTNLLSGLAVALQPLIQGIWKLLPDNVKAGIHGIQTFFHNHLVALEKLNPLKSLEDAWTWLQSWPLWGKRILNYLAQISGHKVVTKSAPMFVRSFATPKGTGTDVPWPWGGIVDSFRAVIGDFDEQAARWVEAIIQGIQDPTDKKRKTLHDATSAFLKPHMEKLASLRDHKTWGAKEIVPEVGAGALADILLGGIPLGLVIWLAHLGVSTLTLGQLNAIYDLEGLVFGTFGFQNLIRQAVNIPLEETIFPKARQFYRSQGRPTLPPTLVVDRMLHWGKISDQDWGAIYSLHGWSDAAQADWHEVFYETPRAFMLAKLIDSFPGLKGPVRSWLKRSGYKPDDIDTLIGAFLKLALKGDITKLKADLVKDFSDGEISLTTLETNLKQLNQVPEEITFTEEIAKIDQARAVRKIKLKNLLIQFKRGELTKDLLTKGLQDLGLQSDRVQLEIQVALLEIPIKPPKPLGEGVLRRLVIDGILSTERYKTELVARGMSAADADLEVLDASKERIRPSRAKAIAQALADFQVIHADPNRLTGDLMKIGLTSEEIQIHVATSQDEYSRNLAKEFEKIYVDGFEKDKLTLDQFKVALKSIMPTLSERRKADIISVASTKKAPAEKFEKAPRVP